MLKIKTDSRRVIPAFSAKEVAEKLGVHLVTVYRWVSVGKVVPIRRGRRVYFPVSSLQSVKK